MNHKEAEAEMDKRQLHLQNQFVCFFIYFSFLFQTSWTPSEPAAFPEPICIDMYGQRPDGAVAAVTNKQDGKETATATATAIRSFVIWIRLQSKGTKTQTQRLGFSHLNDVWPVEVG